MKSVLLAGASAVAISGAAAAQQLPTQVVVDLGASGVILSDVNVDQDSLEFFVPRGEASVRASFGIDEHFSAQFDFQGEMNIGSDEEGGTGGETNTYDGAYQGAVHLSYRDPGQYLVGLFGAYGQVELQGSDDEGGFLGGIEGQYHFGNTTLYGQVGGFTASANDDESLAEAYFLRGVLRHFFSPTSYVSIEGLYGDGESDESPVEDIDFFGWGLRYAHGFSSMPFEGFIGYDGHRMTSDGERVTEHVITVGVTIPFGGPATAQERNTHGVTLDAPLDLLRTAGYTADIID